MVVDIRHESLRVWNMQISHRGALARSSHSLSGAYRPECFPKNLEYC